MLSRYQRQLSLFTPSDKTLLSDPDVKEFNLSDAQKKSSQEAGGMSERQEKKANRLVGR